MKARLEALADDKGHPLKSLVFKPKELYKNVRNVAPDLIVHFGGLYWRVDWQRGAWRSSCAGR